MVHRKGVNGINLKTLLGVDGEKGLKTPKKGKKGTLLKYPIKKKFLLLYVTVVRLLFGVV